MHKQNCLCVKQLYYYTRCMIFFSLQRYHQFIAFFPPFLWKLHNYLEPVKMIKLFSTNPHTIPLY